MVPVTITIALCIFLHCKMKTIVGFIGDILPEPWEELAKRDRLRILCFPVTICHDNYPCHQRLKKSV